MRNLFYLIILLLSPIAANANSDIYYKVEKTHIMQGKTAAITVLYDADEGEIFRGVQMEFVLPRGFHMAFLENEEGVPVPGKIGAYLQSHNPNLFLHAIERDDNGEMPTNVFMLIQQDTTDFPVGEGIELFTFYVSCDEDVELNEYSFVTTHLEFADVRTGQSRHLSPKTMILSVISTSVLSANDVSLFSGNSAGKKTTLSIGLDNEDELVAFEFYMTLPEGVSIALDEDGYPDAVLNDARSDRHTLEVEESSDGSYHFLCYSNRNNALKGNSGELLSIKLVCDEDMEPGAYQGLLSSIKFVDADENRIRLLDLSFDIEVVDIKMGDVNDDGDIDVLDVVAMVNYIMEKPSANFIFAAADHDEDGLVDVVDLVKEVRLVMSQAANAPSTSFDQLGGGLSLVAGQDGAVTLNIDDAASYVASQFLVTLSHGQRLADVTTDKRHTVSFEQVSDNQYVVVSYSNTNACYASNTAALTLHVEGGGQVNVEGATFVSDNRERVSFQNVNSEHTDGIRYASYDFARPADIYSTSGALLKKNATSADGLKAGVYVVNGNKYLKK